MSRQTKITSFFKSNTKEVLGDVKKESSITVEDDVIIVNEFKRKIEVEEESKEDSKDQNAQFFKKRRRECPFYKKVPNTPFAVDAFSYRYIPSVTYYILSHFHADHYQGLSKGWPHPILCTPITARLVEFQFKISPSLIRTININETVFVEGISITFLDANHCPGSAMILFTLPNGDRYLHTGDFRACKAMQNYEVFKYGTIQRLYLDTTYCDPTYQFPTQDETINFIVSICTELIKTNPKVLIVCGSYLIGKEKVFIAIAKALNFKVWTRKRKQEIFKCYEDKSLNNIMSANQNVAQLHVLAMNEINYDVSFI